MRVVASVTVLLIVVVSLWWWANNTHTPKALYEARCSSCHALPDLSRHRPGEVVAIIETMRHRNGAASVISETEAEEIIEYLRDVKSQ